jgi:hypothetical protein
MNRKKYIITFVAVFVFIFFFFLRTPAELPTDVRDDIWETSYEYMVEVLVESSPYEPMEEEQYEKYNAFIDGYNADAVADDPLTDNERAILYHLKGLVYHAQHFRILYQECGECYTDEANEQLEKMVESELELFAIYNVSAAQFYSN